MFPIIILEKGTISLRVNEITQDSLKAILSLETLTKNTAQFARPQLWTHVKPIAQIW